MKNIKFPVISNLGMTTPALSPAPKLVTPSLTPPKVNLTLPALAPLLSPKKARPKPKKLSLSRGETL